MPYVELHARSAFSFLEGASLPESLALYCAQREIGAMALLDRDGFYGSPRFHLAAEPLRIKAHVGSEISIAGGGSYPILVKSQTGYQNLCRLITTAKIRANKKTVATSTLAEFEGHTEGLICLTGDENGPLALALKMGGVLAARQAIEQLVAIFGKENIYVELQRHFHRRQESRNQACIALAREFRLPLVATNGVCYATPAEREIADV